MWGGGPAGCAMWVGARVFQKGPVGPQAWTAPACPSGVTGLPSHTPTEPTPTELVLLGPAHRDAAKIPAGRPERPRRGIKSPQQEGPETRLPPGPVCLQATREGVGSPSGGVCKRPSGLFCVLPVLRAPPVHTEEKQRPKETTDPGRPRLLGLSQDFWS